TIRLLVDELSRVEATRNANQADWEHLTEWLEELERRVEGQDGEDGHDLKIRLEGQEQNTDAKRMKIDRERREWELQRQAYRQEIDRLSRALKQIHSLDGDLNQQQVRTSDDRQITTEWIESLRLENDQLRAAWQELIEHTTAAGRSDGLDTKLA